MWQRLLYTICRKTKDAELGFQNNGQNVGERRNSMFVRPFHQLLRGISDSSCYLTVIRSAEFLGSEISVLTFVKLNPS